MTQQEAAPGADPSMEDILASIRRILNDGEAEPGAAPDALAADAPAAEASAPVPLAADELAAPAPSAAQPAAAQPPAAQPADETLDDVFLLDQTMLIEEPAAMPPDPVLSSMPDPDEPIQAAAPAHDYSHLDAGEPPAEPLLAASTAAAASASLGALVRVMGQRNMPVYRGGPTLEDMVRDEIRPLVKSWLDENLAPMVERLVRGEIERVTRGK